MNCHVEFSQWPIRMCKVYTEFCCMYNVKRKKYWTCWMYVINDSLNAVPSLVVKGGLRIVKSKESVQNKGYSIWNIIKLFFWKCLCSVSGCPNIAVRLDSDPWYFTNEIALLSRLQLKILCSQKSGHFQGQLGSCLPKWNGIIPKIPFCTNILDHSKLYNKNRQFFTYCRFSITKHSSILYSVYKCVLYLNIE